jgi:signal transduction histidine kinase
LLDEVYGAVGPEQRDVLSRLETSLGRLQHLIEELLDLSRIEVGEITLRPKAVELSPVIAHVTDTLRALAKEKGITLSTEVEQDLPTITVDLEKVQQILTNLIHNAIKFSPSASAVRIAATANGHGTVQISVADRGIGIAPDDLDKIFIPFYRSPNPAAQAKGTGLGLTIAKHLVELHRGRLWVESRPGEGSTFAFTLPIS